MARVSRGVLRHGRVGSLAAQLPDVNDHVVRSVAGYARDLVSALVVEEWVVVL